MNVKCHYVDFSLITETITADFFAFGEKICASSIENVTRGTSSRYFKERQTGGDFLFIFYQLVAPEKHI